MSSFGSLEPLFQNFALGHDEVGRRMRRKRLRLANPRTLCDTYQMGVFLRYFSHYEELLDNMKRLDMVEVGEEMKEKKQ